MSGVVLSLCDYTGNMVRPWAEAGYLCVCVDLRNRHETRDGLIHWIREDVREYRLPFKPEIVFAFPPCTNLAVSGRAWFKDKGLQGLIDGLVLVEACRRICEESGAPWMLENPVSTLSTYWRKPDYTFHPADFTGFELSENYTKKTCLWTGGGFIMPDRKMSAVEPPDDRLHRLPPSEDRGHLRSVTPNGFARAVFEANAARLAA